MDSELLIERVKRWGGIATESDAERAILCALRGLREAMFDEEAAALAKELPRPFAQPLQIKASGAIANMDELYRHAARCEGVPVRAALEHVQAVCQALASLLPNDVVTAITKALPRFAELFVVPDRSSQPAAALRAGAQTLAEGRPGSRHPLSEARPGSEHPLSESAPSALEATTIAEGRTGSEHPLSEARPGSEHPLSDGRPARGARRPP